MKIMTTTSTTKTSFSSIMEGLNLFQIEATKLEETSSDLRGTFENRRRQLAQDIGTQAMVAESHRAGSKYLRVLTSAAL